MSIFYDLFEFGCEVMLYIYYVQKEDSVLLYGFLCEGEWCLFCDVQKVSGIGVKIVLVVLFGVFVEEFVCMVQVGDIMVLICIFGIGKKIVECMVLELCDCVVQFGVGGVLFIGSGLVLVDLLFDVIVVLQQLGYKLVEVVCMVCDVFNEGDEVVIVICKVLQLVLC